MTLGSLFAGVGGLDVACEAALGVSTSWQLDLVGAAVRRRHWPDALQVEADVATVDPLALPRVDVLVGGFSCKDLSCAGTGGGLLDGRNTGPTYRHLVRFTEALCPDLVVMENVPGLLTQWRHHLEHDWRRMGYGLTWVPCMALDAGAPHRRRRVFVVAERGAMGRGVLEVDASGRWRAEYERTWPTPCARDDRSAGGRRHTKGGTCLPDEAAQVRPWPTPNAGRFNESEDHESHRRRSDALVAKGSRPLSEPLGMAVRTWPPPTAKGNDNRADYAGKAGDGLATAVRTWPTPVAADGVKASDVYAGGNSTLTGAVKSSFGSRLSADWVETLQGLPVGWTETTGPRMHVELDPRWPRGRYPEDWDRSEPWPGYDWEPARTLPDGPPARGRPARLRALGNLACPQQAVLALRAWQRPAQVGLFTRRTA